MQPDATRCKQCAFLRFLSALVLIGIGISGQLPANHLAFSTFPRAMALRRFNAGGKKQKELTEDLDRARQSNKFTERAEKQIVDKRNINND